MPGEIKVIVAHKEGKGSIGIQSPDCDPVFRTFEGDLEAGLKQVPAVLEKARQLWETNPQYPKCESPLPSQAEPPRSTRQSSSPKQPKQQPSMF